MKAQHESFQIFLAVSGSNKIVCVELLETNLLKRLQKYLADNQVRKTYWTTKGKNIVHRDRTQRGQYTENTEDQYVLSKLD